MEFRFMEAPSLLCVCECREKEVSFYLLGHPWTWQCKPRPLSDSLLRRTCRNTAAVASFLHCGKAQGSYELARGVAFRPFFHENRNIDFEGKKCPFPSRGRMRGLHLGMEREISHLPLWTWAGQGLLHPASFSPPLISKTQTTKGDKSSKLLKISQ